MKAFVHLGISGVENTRIEEITSPEPGPLEVKVKVITAGLNHRDLFILDRNKEKTPLVLGSDAAGIVEEIGSDVEGISVGQEVVINPGLNWPEESEAPPEDFQLVGFPGNGTFAEFAVVPAANLEPKPPHFTWEEAGTFSLAALTAYRALVTRANLQPSHTLLLPGAGSGAVTFMLLFAKKIGARVIVTSRSEEKRKRALELGADKAIDSEGDWNEQLEEEKADIVIDTVGAVTFQKSLDQLKKGGTMVIFGASAGDEVTLNLRSFFYGQYNLLGSTMGSHEEYQDMLAFISKHNIHPVVDKVYPLEEAAEAMKYLEKASQFGKIALRVADEKEEL
ncbi:zinc-binding dehydrogenase [Alkalicoccus daliensis]|uniref:Zinc-binding alcohol dehydrogenase/oxidoreductase n=1 Tax=Alkalicoccus daliensis TaxID=745820 RepID=A0A1G9ZJ11_9BACI|nr:zinc-binding dehydrogenase [Alkalicoccus daliensis]SDN21329.1 zinc-binding alcohol dehydrogenase/oxidoreductase [Alkalicoccus daliensis]